MTRPIAPQLRPVLPAWAIVILLCLFASVAGAQPCCALNTAVELVSEESAAEVDLQQHRQRPTGIAADRVETLVAAAQQAQVQVGTRPFPSLASAAQDVLDAIEHASKELQRRSSAQRAEAWLAYLRTAPLAEALRSDAEAERVMELARQVHGRAVGVHDGLELEPVVELRRRVGALVDVVRLTRDGQRQMDAAGRTALLLDNLAQRLSQLEPVPSADDTAALATLINLIEVSQQAPALVQTICAEFAQPNVVITVGGHLIEDAIGRQVDRQRPIRDCILGTRIHGTGHLRGQVDGRLVPAQDRVGVALTLSGRFRSQSIGYNRSVRLPSVGDGRATAKRTMYIDEQGIVMSSTSAASSLRTQVTSIQHASPLVRKIARRQLAKKQGKAEAIARQRLRQRVAEDFTRQTTEAARGQGPEGGLATRLKEARVKLVRLNLEEPARGMYSTTEQAVVEVTQRDTVQLAACNAHPRIKLARSPADPDGAAMLTAKRPSEPPQESSLSALAAVAIQVHESVVDNVASRVLGGRTMTGEQIDRLLGEFDRGPKADDETDTEEAFEIDFYPLRPIIMEARAQTLRIGLRGSRFSQQGRELRRQLEITALYQPATGDDGQQVLQRDGDVSVDFPGTRRLSIQQVALRRSIQRIFDKRFPEVLFDTPLTLPDTIDAELLRGRSFLPVMLDVRDGWLSIALR